VLVRDAQNRPLSGVAVQFAVTSGGGAVDGASASTDAAGIARATRWTLGPAGEQQLSATVGSLAPVVFRATLIPGTEMIEIGVGTGAGGLAITQDGHPLKGLEVKIPAGAFDAAGQLTVRVARSQTVPNLPAGYRVAGTVVEVGTELPRSRKLFTVDVPVTRTAGRDVVVAFRDPARGVLEVMPTVARTPTAVRVMTAHLRADLVLGPGLPGAAAAARGGAAGPFSLGQLVPIDFPVPTPPVAAVVDPTQARWPVVEFGTAAAPAGHGPAIAALQQLMSADGGTPVRSAFRGLAKPGFYAEAGPMAVAAMARQTLNLSTASVTFELSSALGSLPKAERDEVVSRQLAASLSLQGHPPTMVFRSAGTSVTFANALSFDGGGFKFLQPSSSLLGQLTYSAAGFATFSAEPTADAPPVAIDEVVPLPSFALPFESVAPLAADLRQLGTLTGAPREALNESLAIRAGMPALEFEQEAVPGEGFSPLVSGNGVVYGASAQFRIKPGGLGSLQFGFHLPATGATVGESVSGTLPVSGIAGFSAVPNQTTTPYVVSVFRAAPQPTRARSAATGPQIRQVSARTLTLRWAKFQVAPETVTLDSAGAPVDLQATIEDRPARYRIEWNWGDGVVESFSGTDKARHVYGTPGDYDVIVKLKDESAAPVVTLAVDTVRVRGTGLPFWRITQFSDPGGLLDFGIPGQSGELFEVLTRIVAEPRAGLIAIDSAGPRTFLRLRVLPGAIWESTANCCPPAAGLTELRQTLGEMPAVPSGVGPYFSAWPDSRWQQSTPDLGAGTLTGRYIMGTIDYKIKDVGVQIGPRGVIAIQGTRNGRQMTGKISITVWWVGDESGEVEDEETFDLPFVATRIR